MTRYPDPARCRFPAAVTLDPLRCHCGRPLARVELRFTAPGGRTIADPYYRHVPARNPKRPADNAAVGERSWTGHVGALSSTSRDLCLPDSERDPPEPRTRLPIIPVSSRPPVENRGVGAGGRIPLYESLDALHAAGFGLRP